MSVLMDGANTSVYHRIINHLPNSQFYTSITKTNHTALKKSTISSSNSISISLHYLNVNCLVVEYNPSVFEFSSVECTEHSLFFTDTGMLNRVSSSAFHAVSIFSSIPGN